MNTYPHPAWPWRLALLGHGVFLFALVALSGPGRIDIVDGQTRYEVARSLIEHGDQTIRDPNVTFAVFPGRNGQLYTNYRFPQSLAGVGAILVSDATGPVREARRHFFFLLTSAVAAALLGTFYAVWFRHLGLSPWACFFWATAGILCTPSWFYATTTFDDILGAATVVLAVGLAFWGRDRRPLPGAALSGLALGLAFNCKQPLGLFVLPVLAAVHDPRLSLRQQWPRFALVLVGLTLGVAAYVGYDQYKFPPGTTASHAELRKHYGPIWSSNPIPALAALTVSPGAGVIWYCPTLLLSVAGLYAWARTEKRYCQAVVAASVLFLGFLSCLMLFAGDPAWGPRYLTSVLALWWVFAPAGARVLRRGLVAALLVFGLVVQLLGLSVDPHRLFIEQRLTPAFSFEYPWLYFHPVASHLLQRPREIRDILRDNRPAKAFSPAPAPTFAFPVIVEVTEQGQKWMYEYHLLNSLRPWWISERYLTPAERPVDFDAALVTFLLMLLGGAGCVVLGCSWGRSHSL